MTRGLASFALVVVAAACGGPPAAGPAEAKSETKAAATTSANATPTPTTQTAAPAPSTTATAATSSAPAEPPKAIGARHVLIQWMGRERAPSSIVRTREQAYALARDVLQRAKAGEDVARLAVEYSDEPNASARGGSLGRFSRGQMVGAFEEAAFKLKVGEISDIVETPFGFHIIERTE